MTGFTTTSGTHVKVWVNDLRHVDTNALSQLDAMGRLPFVHRHIAVMPDVHLGKGAVIGSVFPAKKAVVPNIVGVDIGCGISAFDAGLTRKELTEGLEQQGGTAADFWRRWQNDVLAHVPTGFDQHDVKCEWDGFGVRLHAEFVRPLMDEKARRQLGTLGGGNHFIEAQYDEEDRVWFMVHSGSRHTGLRIAEYYNREAEKLLNRSRTRFPRDLAYLPSDDRLFEDYIHDMTWAVDFALENRWRMLEQACATFWERAGAAGIQVNENARRSVRQRGINIHHNFARLESHFGDKVVVHRKGATSARAGELGIVPGSMGAKSFIVRGKGCQHSFESCAHGAGRVMSRREAKKTIDQDEYEQSLAATYTVASRSYVDESPTCYKNVDDVVRQQADLVDVVTVLRPIITLKGDSRARDD